MSFTSGAPSKSPNFVSRSGDNPVLVAFREDARVSVGTDAGGFIETVGTLADHWLMNDATGNGYATAAEKEHALKVFARLSFRAF